MAYLAFSFAAVAVCAAALLGAASLRLQVISFAIAAYVIGWAGVVGLGEVLSLLDAVGRSGYVLGSGLLLAVAVAGCIVFAALMLWLISPRRQNSSPPAPKLTLAPTSPIR